MRQLFLKVEVALKQPIFLYITMLERIEKSKRLLLLDNFYYKKVENTFEYIKNLQELLLRETKKRKKRNF
jgi:hypothetical protein